MTPTETLVSGVVSTAVGAYLIAFPWHFPEYLTRWRERVTGREVERAQVVLSRRFTVAIGFVFGVNGVWNLVSYFTG